MGKFKDIGILYEKRYRVKVVLLLLMMYFFLLFLRIVKLLILNFWLRMVSFKWYLSKNLLLCKKTFKKILLGL